MAEDLSFNAWLYDIQLSDDAYNLSWYGALFLTMLFFLSILTAKLCKGRLALLVPACKRIAKWSAETIVGIDDENPDKLVKIEVFLTYFFQ